MISQGVLARSVLDTAMVLNLTAGPDPSDWRSLPAQYFADNFPVPSDIVTNQFLDQNL